MKKLYAFTFIEVLVALAIFCLMAGISVPGLQAMLARGQSDNLRRQLMALIDEARDQSEISMKPISICGSSTGGVCDGGWQQNQLIFIDKRKNGEIRDKKQIVRIKQLNLHDGMLFVRFYPKYRNFILFAPTRKKLSDNGSIWFCQKNASNPAWLIKLSKMGNMQTVLPNKHGEVLNSQHHKVNC